MEIGELRELLQVCQPQCFSCHARDVVAEASSFHLDSALTVERPLSLVSKLDGVFRARYRRSDLVQDLLKGRNGPRSERQV
jgi:hypothetical protein